MLPVATLLQWERLTLATVCYSCLCSARNRCLGPTINAKASFRPHTIDSPIPTTMADREHSVFQAKLAEQAERYDGKDLGDYAHCRVHLSALFNVTPRSLSLCGGLWGAGGEVDLFSERPFKRQNGGCFPNKTRLVNIRCLKLYVTLT